MDHESSEPTPASDHPAGRTKRVGRRTAIKAGIATTTGLMLGGTYVSPTVVSVGVQDVHAVSGRDEPPPQPPEKPGRGRGRSKKNP